MRKKYLLAVKLYNDGKTHPSILRVLTPYFEWLNSIGLYHSDKRVIEYLTPCKENDPLSIKCIGNVIHKMWRKKGYVVVTSQRFKASRMEYTELIPILNGYALK